MDSDIIMNKRAKEVAAKVRPVRGSFRRARGGRATFVVSTFGRARAVRARGRGGSRSLSTGGRRGSVLASAAHLLKLERY